MKIKLDEIKQEEESIVLEFFNITTEDINFQREAILLGLDVRRFKVDALARLRIKVEDGQSPLDAWILAMCQKNGLPQKLPATRIGDAAMELCKEWVWWLAG